MCADKKMPKSEIHNNITELDKIETTIELCINYLYNEKVDKQGVAGILEMLQQNNFY